MPEVKENKQSKEKTKTNKTEKSGGVDLKKVMEMIAAKRPIGQQDQATFLVTGTTPLMQSSTRLMEYLEKLEEDNKKLIREGKDKDLIKKFDPKQLLKEEVVEFQTYPTDDGRFYHPARAFFCALIDGFNAVKAKMPGTKGANVGNFLKPIVRVTHQQAVIVDPKTFQPYHRNGEGNPYDIKTMTICNRSQSSIKRIVTHRPIWKEWAAFVTFEYDPSMCNPQLINQGLNVGGSIIGVGAYRPTPPKGSDGKGGIFGRFTSEVWKDEIPKAVLGE